MLQATFGVLRQILLDLGFTVHVGSDYVRFDHARSKTSFLYPRYGEADDVHAGNLVAARRVLDERGLMPRERFEELLRQKVVAS